MNRLKECTYALCGFFKSGGCGVGGYAGAGLGVGLGP